MPVNFVRRTFDRWSTQNFGRFRHGPVVAEQRKNFFVCRFGGITPHVQCFIGWKWRVEVIAIHEGEVWDILADFDVAERRSAQGRYRSALRNEPIEYASREALWIAEAFEPLLAWVGDTLAEAEVLSIYERPGGGARYAKLSKASAVEGESAEWLIANYSLLVPREAATQAPADARLTGTCSLRGEGA